MCCFQAEDGIILPVGIFDLPNIDTSAKLYFTFTRFDILWTLNHFALIALNFFEVSVLYFKRLTDYLKLLL